MVVCFKKAYIKNASVKLIVLEGKPPFKRVIDFDDQWLQIKRFLLLLLLFMSALEIWRWQLTTIELPPACQVKTCHNWRHSDDDKSQEIDWRRHMYCQRNVIKSVKCKKRSLKCISFFATKYSVGIYWRAASTLSKSFIWSAINVLLQRKSFYFLLFFVSFQTPFGPRKKYICIVIHKTT